MWALQTKEKKQQRFFLPSGHGCWKDLQRCRLRQPPQRYQCWLPDSHSIHPLSPPQTPVSWSQWQTAWSYHSPEGKLKWQFERRQWQLKSGSKVCVWKWKESLIYSLLTLTYAVLYTVLELIMQSPERAKDRPGGIFLDKALLVCCLCAFFFR